MSIPIRALYAIESLDDTYSLDTYLYVSYPPSRLDNTWAEVAADYHDQILGPFHPLNAEHELHGLLRLHLPSKQVLDAGCGVGNLAIWCDSVGVRPARLVGLDSSPEMVRQSLKTGYDSVELGAIEKMAFQDGQFDTALAINSVMPKAASNDARRTVRECFLELRRVTKQNGTLIAVLPSFESLYETNSKDALWHSQTDESAVAGDVGFGEKRCLHTLETINAELSGVGFHNLDISKIRYSNEATRALGLTPGAWDWLVTARAQGAVRRLTYGTRSVVMTASEERKVDSRALREAAANSAKNAHAPYSHFHVGAAALTTSGLVVMGCNVENASYGLTLCAECGLISDLVLHQAGKITELVVCSELGEDITPCGRCRQLLIEHASPDCVLHTVSGPVAVSALLPGAFSAESLH